MNERRDLKIHMIPLDRITVVNPRQRGERKFKQIVDNIAKLVLKRPVTVTPSKSHNGVQEYYLVCGQGRFEAFEILGEVEIPAVIIQVSKEQLLLMSLIENLARRLNWCARSASCGIVVIRSQTSPARRTST